MKVVLVVLALSLLLLKAGDLLKKALKINGETIMPYAIHVLAVFIVTVYLFAAIGASLEADGFNGLEYLKSTGILVGLVYLVALKFTRLAIPVN